MPAFSRPSTGLSAIAIPASKNDAVEDTPPVFPSSHRRAEAACARTAGKFKLQPVGAVFEIVQRLSIGSRRIRMIDALHDLPRRSRSAAGDRRGGARARIDRLDVQTRHRSCRPVSRTARPSARHRPACASRRRSRAQNRRPAAGRQSQMSFSGSLPGAVFALGWKLPRGTANTMSARSASPAAARFPRSTGRPAPA